MALRNLQKWHGAGNDFLIDVQEQGLAPWWTPARASALCHREFGVGADGLIVASVGSEVSMLLFNADGTVAEMSGNGIRCLAAAIKRATRAEWVSLDVDTQAGKRHVELSLDDTSGYGSVNMGDVVFEKNIDGALGVVNVGNPHVVVLDNEKLSSHDCEEIAARLSDAVGGANVEFLSVLDPDHLSIRVIERGVGWTQACGTGSCAAAAVAHREGLSSENVTVTNPGGDLRVELDDSSAKLSGPVQFVANVEWLEA